MRIIRILCVAAGSLMGGYVEHRWGIEAFVFMVANGSIFSLYTVAYLHHDKNGIFK